MVLGGQVDGLGVFDDIFDILLGDFAIHRSDQMHPAIIEPPEMSPSHAQVHAADFHISHLFGLNNRLPDVFLCQRRVHDLTFAHPARAGLAQADDVQGAFAVYLTNDSADL